MMSRKTRTDPGVDQRTVDEALAKAVCTGDIVNFRFLFTAFSPARQDSSEQFDVPRYAYLLPHNDLKSDPRFKEALAAVRAIETHTHIQQELEAKRPAQLPAGLVLLLGDNAVRAGKYTSAAQAYELLRLRRRMQDECFQQADAALDAGDVARTVRGYLIGIGLDYDYAAFPEPLPAVPDYQKRALVLHADYPDDPRDSVALQEPEVHIRTALTYLLRGASTAARLAERPLDLKTAFVKELVHALDPQWPAFAGRFREACAMTREFGERLEPTRVPAPQEDHGLAKEIETTLGEDPRRITAHLLGRDIPGGAWWQYLKELAYTHPASVLFIARWTLGDDEILVPRYRPDSPLAVALGLREEDEPPE
ncbi:MAG TPA: hypothetical protein ENN80_05765 [Candidatus Hydrogenedentes bacterium]|nr:hypothetical protein [Candidatus Hydrogenedentota bacterium]